MPRREEVLNVVLAQSLCDSGMAADPENILRDGIRRDMPDVIVSLRGLRCVIEGKTDDVPNAQKAVAGDADDRLEHGVAHVAVAVVYPAALRDVPFEDIAHRLRTAVLRFIVRTEPRRGTWRQGTLDDIVADLRRAHELLIEDDVLTRSVQHLNNGMTQLVAMLVQHDASLARLAALLEVRERDEDDSADADGAE